MKRGSCTHPEGEVPTGRTGPGCFFGLDGGGGKRGENNEGSGSALWGNEEAAAIPSAWAWGRGSSGAEHSPSSLRGPTEPPSLAGSTETPQRCPAHPIYLQGPGYGTRVVEGRNDPGIRGVAHGAGAGNERSAPVCIAPPALLGVCCGCRGGRGARRGGGGSEHLEEPRLVGAAAAGGELCRSQRCGNLKRRWLGTRLHERWHWGRAQPPRPPPPLRVREANPTFGFPFKQSHVGSSSPGEEEAGGGTALSPQGPRLPSSRAAAGGSSPPAASFLSLSLPLPGGVAA